MVVHSGYRVSAFYCRPNHTVDVLHRTDCAKRRAHVFRILRPWADLPDDLSFNDPVVLVPSCRSKRATFVTRPLIVGLEHFQNIYLIFCFV